MLASMNSVFITGISTAGKSYLAKRVASSLGVDYINLDELRSEMEKDLALEPWVNFYWHKNEAEYYQTTIPEEQWQDLVKQSEAFWPTMKRKIEGVLASGKPTIFEAVNLLPHLVKELPIKGIVLLGNSEQEIFERLAAVPRWGNTEELQHLEANALFSIERPRYKAEAEKYGYSAYSEPTAAEDGLTRLITMKVTEARDYLGKIIEVTIDRPLDSKHPRHGFDYPVNYGFIPGTTSGDGEELDAYVLGVDEPRENFTGRCIAVIHRTNDDDDKLVVVPDGVTLSDDEIRAATHFQEQYFVSDIIRELL